MQALAAITLALMPVFMALGMLASPIGLVLAMQFLMLAMLLIMVIIQVLDVIQDPFSYYDGDAPTERGPEWSAEKLADAGGAHPTTPEDACVPGSWGVTPLSLLSRTTYGSGAGSTVMKGIWACLMLPASDPDFVLVMNFVVLWGDLVSIVIFSAAAIVCWLGWAMLASLCATLSLIALTTQVVVDVYATYGAMLTCESSGWWQAECLIALSLALLGIYFSHPFIDLMLDIVSWEVAVAFKVKG